MVSFRDSEPIKGLDVGVMRVAMDFVALKFPIVPMMLLKRPSNSHLPEREKRSRSQTLRNLTNSREQGGGGFAHCCLSGLATRGELWMADNR